MANSLVVRKTQLPQSQTTFRAAQYVRMSTDKQRYSIQNQAAVIAAYAYAHSLTIVRTYADEGESGLRIKNREGLKQLIHDVCSGQADFQYVLVYDVSRWGRFQDVDESAHYEFICKQAGVKIAYCAEQFDNDGSLLSSIVKNLKRIMAAEYSRELSAKVHAGQCRLVALGFKPGGPAMYALRRELVDEHMKSKGLLGRGDRKYLITDRVKLRLGPTHEATTVKWIFDQFVIERKSATEIARQLTRSTMPSEATRCWNCRGVIRLLKNENYVGNIVYNRLFRRLGQKTSKNPTNLWIRCSGAVEPIIDTALFSRAQEIIEARRVDLTEDEMLVRLRKTLMRRRRLSVAIINETVGLPSTATYMEHFGTIRNAYRLIGYISKRDCDYIDSGHLWSEEVARLSSHVAASLEAPDRRVSSGSAAGSLLVNGQVGISVRIARWWLPVKPTHAPRWAIYHGKSLPDGWIVVIRLAQSNKAVLDYLLMPTSSLAVAMIKFTDKAARIRHKADRFESIDLLIRAITERMTTTPDASPARPMRPNRPSRSGPSKTTTGRARH